MSVLPQDSVALVMVVFMLGLQHGMDPDHIATINGLTRFNAKLRPRIARWSMELRFYWSLTSMMAYILRRLVM